MNLACANFAFPLLPFDAALDLIAALQFDGIDLGLFAGSSHVDSEETLGNVRSSAAALSARLRDRNLVLADLFVVPGAGFEALAPNHPDAAERARSRDLYLRAVDFAGRVDACHITTLSGVLFAEESKQSSFARCTQELAWRVEVAAAAGIPFGVEALIPWASHFHARCTCPGRLQCSTKENTVDFERVIRTMTKQGYCGAIGIEYVWIDWQQCNEVDNLSETILLRDLIREAMEGG
ncbi:MAG: TIM barrel protein [bacterium]|nr:TIM barrel protein [bacterium]